jgi:DNA gyrase subunit A
VAEAALSAERIASLGAAEEFIFTVADDGMGKRSSAYDYRVTGRFIADAAPRKPVRAPEA